MGLRPADREHVEPEAAEQLRGLAERQADHARV
jgi:hypothetical protein